MHGHVILCGFGHVGYRVARLLRRLGLEVVVLYDQAPAEWIREAEAGGCLCLQGDARSTALLEAAGIAGARALVAATDRDLVNLSIALDARRLNPGLVQVVRMFDQHLAPHMGRMLEVRGPFSTTALAAPVFVAAALGDEVVECLSIAGAPFVVAEVRSGAGGTSGGEMPFLRASKDAVRVASASEPADTAWDATLVLRRSAPSRARGARRRSAARVRWSPREALALVPAGLRGVLLGLVAVTTLSVFVFSAGLRIPLLDALYFVMTTITTVGYGDINLLQAPQALKLYGVLLMLCGAMLLATLFGIVTDLVVSTRLREVVAAGAKPPGAHVVVAGCGHMGQRVVAELRRAGEDVVVVDADRQDAACRALGPEVLVIGGDPRDRNALLRAGIADARAFIGLSDDDLTNLGAALLARDLNPGLRTVARVFDSALGDKVREHLGIDQVLSISALAAPVLAAACLFPDVIEAFVWRGHLVVARLLGPGAAVTGDVGEISPVRMAHSGRLAVALGPGGPRLADGESGGTGGDRVVEVIVLALHGEAAHPVPKPKGPAS